MNVNFTPRAWYEYTGWQLEDKKILKRINLLIKDIERNGNTGIGKPEPLRNMNGCWSRRITCLHAAESAVRFTSPYTSALLLYFGG